jgi:DNA-binding protein H-NS
MKTEEMRMMSTEALLEMRRQVNEVLSSRRQELEHQLEEITGKPPYDSSSRPTEAAEQISRGSGRPKYQSRQNSALIWSGRGLIPRWMRNEMKGTKLTKEDFRLT